MYIHTAAAYDGTTDDEENDMYLMQAWNPTSETWMTAGEAPIIGMAGDWYDGDPDNRRVIDADTREIVMQPDA